MNIVCKGILLASAAVILLAALAVAENYQPGKTYHGFYSNTRIYRYDTQNQLWRANDPHKELGNIRCQSAASNLTIKGFWTGNLRRNGECAPPGEAPTLAMGNYLNYLNAVGATFVFPEEQ